MQNSEKKFLHIFKCGKYLNMLKLSDANLQTDDGCNFDIHRFALAMSSDYFNRMFLGIMEDERRRKFHIPGISGECLSNILCYVYTGDTEITERNVADLIIGADYLLMDNLLMKIKGNIEDNLTEVNCLRTLHAAHQISDEVIFRKCFRFIQMRFEGIMQCEGEDLTDLPLGILRRILSNRSLCVYDETTVWQAIITWTQKDIQRRMCCVPQLILTLAMDDVGEELATKILQHEIVSENCAMKDLVEIASSNEFSTNLDVLLTFFSSYSNRFTEPILRHRIPPQLFVAWSDDGGEMNLYITYDENTDLWRKITESRVSPEVLIAIGHNIYIFNMTQKICMKFDLSAMNWVRMESFTDISRYSILNLFCIVAIDAYIYVIGQVKHFGSFHLEIYDTANNRWQYGPRPDDVCIFHTAAVAIENKIYAVGENITSDAMIMQIFDPDTQKWSILSPPTIYHSEFSLVAYHQKIYLIGCLEAEVFDPASNLWKKLPGGSCERSSPKAMVISDKIIVSDTKREYYEYWNNAGECWEKLEHDTLKGLSLTDSLFCTIDDVETIRMITDRNRDPETQMEKRRFY